MPILPETKLLLIPVVLAAQGLLVHWASSGERPPAAPDFSAVPARFQNWVQVREDPVEADVARELHADRLLNRVYTNVANPLYANLFAAWFQSQRGGAQPHSPKVCLPGSGWVIQSSRQRLLTTPKGVINVNQMRVANRGQHAVVLYWYQNPRRVITQEWAAKLWVVADALRYHRTDLELVRVVVWEDGSEQQAASEAAAFAAAAYGWLSAA